jgi:hypothetical protein
VLKTTTPAIEYVDRSAKLRIKHTGCVNKLSHKLRWRHEIAVFESLEHFFCQAPASKASPFDKRSGGEWSGATSISKKASGGILGNAMRPPEHVYGRAHSTSHSPRARSNSHTQHTASLAQRAEIIIFVSFCRCIFIVAKRPFHVSRSIKLPLTKQQKIVPDLCSFILMRESWERIFRPGYLLCMLCPCDVLASGDAGRCYTS